MSTPLVGPTQAARKNLRSSGMAGNWERILPVVIYLRTMSVLVAIWYLAHLRVGNDVLLPSPLSVAESLYRLGIEGELWKHSVISVRRLLIGFGLAAVLGIPLGILMGFSKLAKDLVDPMIELLRPISGIAWIPIALFIFGIGNILPIFIILYGAFFPIVLNTIAGVRTVDPILVRAAQTMGMSRWTTVRHIVFPSALPNILIGVRLGAGAGWMSLVAAELIGAPSGLGFSVEWYRELLMTSKVLAFIIVIGVLGYGTDRILRLIQRRMTPWAMDMGESR